MKYSGLFHPRYAEKGKTHPDQAETFKWSFSPGVSINYSMMTNYQTAKRPACHVELKRRLYIQASFNRVALILQPRAKRDRKEAVSFPDTCRAGQRGNVGISWLKDQQTPRNVTQTQEAHKVWLGRGSPVNPIYLPLDSIFCHGQGRLKSGISCRLRETQSHPTH